MGYKSRQRILVKEGAQTPLIRYSNKAQGKSRMNAFSSLTKSQEENQARKNSSYVQHKY